MKKSLLVFLFLFFPVVVSASTSFPTFPMIFYGDVTLNNQLLSVSSTVRAYCDNTMVGEVVLSEAGVYGDEDLMGKKLLVDQYSGCSKLVFKYAEAGSVSFGVGIDEQSYTGSFQAGITVKKDLNFKTQTTSGGGGGGGGAAAPVSSVNAIDVPLVINGTQEGTISYNSGDNDSVQVVIPKNSFTGTATFKVVNSTLAGNDPIGGSAINGGVYIITAADSNNNPLTSFSNNITITFSGLVLPADLSSVGVYYLNETTNEWVLINGSVFDQATGKVTFSVNHFTKFAVLNVPGTPSTVKNSVTKITAIDGTVIEGKLKIKVSGKPAIYWLDQNNNYYYYPDGDVFKSWNVDESYNYYKAVSQTSFNNLVQPSVAPYHVFYRNGSEVVKYLSSDKLYVVGLNNTLYPITNDAIVSLYGSKYKAKTIGLSEWPYYVKDTTTTVDVNSVYPGMFIKIAGKNYFIDNERKMREITADAMRPNHLKPSYFRTLSVNAVTGLEVGETITSKVSELTSFVGY